MCGNREYMENSVLASQVYYEFKAALKRKKKLILGMPWQFSDQDSTLTAEGPDQQTKILQVHGRNKKEERKELSIQNKNRRGVRESERILGKMLIVLTVRLNNEHVGVSFTVLTAYMHI